MTTNQTETARQIITDALLEIQAARLGVAPDASEMDIGVRHLNRLMKSWQGEGSQFLRTNGTLTLTTDASYPFDGVTNPLRPLRFITCRLKQNGIETPMFEMNREDYEDLPQKDSTGLPTQFFYDRQAESGTFYVWPVLSVANGQTIEYSYEREYEDMNDPDAVPDFPVEFYNSVVILLADSLAGVFGRSAWRMENAMRVMEAKSGMLGNEVEESFYWRDKYA